MDNRRIDITVNGNLEGWLKLAMPYEKAVGWADRGRDDDGTRRIVLFWSPSKRDDYVPFPGHADAAALAVYVRQWLDAVTYHRIRDFDGDTGKGFRIYNEAWGHVDDEWQAMLAIQPVVALYGK